MINVYSVINKPALGGCVMATRKKKISFALMNILIKGTSASIQAVLDMLDKDSYDYELELFSFDPENVDYSDATIVKLGIIFVGGNEKYLTVEEVPGASIPDIKFIGMGDGGDAGCSDGTYVFYKDFGEILISECYQFSIYNPHMEEFEGQYDVLENVFTSFMDHTWSYIFEDFSCGEYVPYAFDSSKDKELIAKWEDDKNALEIIKKYARAVLPGDKSSPKSGKTRKVDGEKLKSLSIGDNIFFGKYPQKRKSTSEPIEWMVLDKQDTMVMLISKLVLDNQPFHENKKASPWSDSLIRTWLEEEFIPKAFDVEEQRYIAETTIIEPDNTGVKHTSQDRVFLLSEKEVKKYMPTPESRMTKETRYAGNSYWGLRSYKKGADSFQYCTWTGSKIMSNKFGDEKDSFFHNYDCTLGVRPAMWLRIDISDMSNDNGTLNAISAEEIEKKPKESAPFLAAWTLWTNDEH